MYILKYTSQVILIKQQIKWAFSHLHVKLHFSTHPLSTLCGMKKAYIHMFMYHGPKQRSWKQTCILLERYCDCKLCEAGQTFHALQVEELYQWSLYLKFSCILGLQVRFASKLFWNKQAKTHSRQLRTVHISCCLRSDNLCLVPEWSKTAHENSRMLIGIMFNNTTQAASRGSRILHW